MDKTFLSVHMYVCNLFWAIIYFGKHVWVIQRIVAMHGARHRPLFMFLHILYDVSVKDTC